MVATGHGYELLWGYVVPQRIGIVILAWWFDYLPHNGLEATQREDKYRATRVRVGGEALLTPLFVYQNYHLVHHLHPSVPFYRYVRAWRRNEQAMRLGRPLPRSVLPLLVTVVVAVSSLIALALAIFSDSSTT